MTTALIKLKPYFLECLEAGVDEVGRGSFAGPVVTAAVILPKNFKSDLVKDSKKLNEKQRKTAEELIKRKAIGYSIDFGTVTEVDSLNILQATFTSMHRALDGLERELDHIIIDGDKFIKYKNVPHTCIVKGDAYYYSIAAASILAKVARDEYMVKMSEFYPQYKWDVNKGYGTADHCNALLQYGPTEHHRKTFISNYIKPNPPKLF